MIEIPFTKIEEIANRLELTGELYLMIAVGSMGDKNENLEFKNKQIVKKTGSMLELVVKEIQGNVYIIERNIMEKILIKND